MNTGLIGIPDDHQDLLAAIYIAILFGDEDRAIQLMYQLKNESLDVNS